MLFFLQLSIIPKLAAVLVQLRISQSHSLLLLIFQMNQLSVQRFCMNTQLKPPQKPPSLSSRRC